MEDVFEAVDVVSTFIITLPVWVEAADAQNSQSALMIFSQSLNALIGTQVKLALPVATSRPFGLRQLSKCRLRPGRHGESFERLET